MPQETPLTDTELIELASMVEDLQDSLISSYYNYKNTLSQLKDTRSKMILYSRNYSKALTGQDVLEIAISSSLYDAMRIQEFQLEQSAKKYHIQLQRLAGKKLLMLWNYINMTLILYFIKIMMLLKRTEVRMAKNKFVVSLMLAALLMLPVSAEVKLDDVTTPKDIFYRLGTTDTPENKIDVNSKEEVKAQIVKEENTIAKDLLMQI